MSENVNASAEWSKATISNNFMFRLVMEDKEICKELLQRVLDMKISKISYIEGEKSLEANLTTKGIRLDIYAEDEHGTAYDIEMQTGNSGAMNLAKRTRYYQAVMDSKALEKGVPYKNLRRSIIIFICTFDPFGANFGRYTFNAFCEEDKAIALHDGCTRIFVNTKGRRDNLSNKLAVLMEYISSGAVNDSFTETMNRKVNTLRSNDGIKERYIVWYQMIEQEKAIAREEAWEEGRAQGRAQGRAEGRAEGRAQGRAEGLAEGEARGEARGKIEGMIQGKIETYCDLIREGTFSLAHAAEKLNMSVSEFTQKAHALAML